MTWTRRVKARPPGSLGATILVDPERGETLLVVEDADRVQTSDEPVGRGQVWSWAGDGWERRLDGLFAFEDAAGPPTGVFDPARGETMLYQLGQGRLYRSALAAPHEVERLEVDLDVWPSRVVAIFDEARGRTLLQLDGVVLAIEGRDVTTLLDDEEQQPMTFVWDAAGQRALALTVFDKLVTLGGDGAWHELEAGAARSGSDLAFDPGSGRVLRLMSDPDPDSDDEDGRMRLYALSDRGFEPLEVTMRPFVSGGTLGVDPARGQLLSYGGQDFSDGQGGYSDQTWCGPLAGGELTRAADPRELVVGRHTTLCPSDGHLVAFNHSSLSVSRLEGDRWVTDVPGLSETARHEPPYRGADLYDLGVNFTASDAGYYVLDGSGRVWSATRGGRFEPRADAGPGGGHYARRTALAYDAAREALIVHGGPETNATFVLRDGAWAEVETELGPAPGIASAVHTSEGVYLLAGRDLFRFDEGRFRCVGTDPERRRQSLMVDPKRGALLAVDADRGAVSVWDDGRWRDVAALPEGTRIQSGFSGGDGEVGVDPERDQLVVIEGSAQWSISLGELDLPSDALPRADVAPTDAVPPPPEDRVVDALAIELVPGAAPVPIEESGVEVPQDYELVAVLPLAELGVSAVVCIHRAPWELEGERAYVLGGPSVRIELREPVAAPQLAVPFFEEDDPEPDDGETDDEPGPYDGDQDAHDGEDPGEYDDDAYDEPYDDRAQDPLREARLVPFREVSADDMERYGALPGGAARRARGSKLSGHPYFIQAEESGTCSVCEAPLRFAFQLTAGLYDTRFGDAGSLYGFVCPDGHEAQGVVQSA